MQRDGSGSEMATGREIRTRRRAAGRRRGRARVARRQRCRKAATGGTAGRAPARGRRQGSSAALEAWAVFGRGSGHASPAVRMRKVSEETAGPRPPDAAQLHNSAATKLRVVGWMWRAGLGARATGAEADQQCRRLRLSHPPTPPRGGSAGLCRGLRPLPPARLGGHCGGRVRRGPLFRKINRHGQLHVARL